MKHTFSAMWSDDLRSAILVNYETLNPAGIPFFANFRGADHARIIKAVNQGIDAHLEACYVPQRGDRYVCSDTGLQCRISRHSLPALVRRLLEEGDDLGMQLASSICSTLDIELV